MKKYLALTFLTLSAISPAAAQNADGSKQARLNDATFMAQFYEDEAQTKLRSGPQFSAMVAALLPADRETLDSECRFVRSPRATFCESLRATTGQ